MNLQSLFQHSTQLRDFTASVTSDAEFSDVLLKAQIAVGTFLASIGKDLTDDIVADTFLMHSEVFSSNEVKFFAVSATLMDRATAAQYHYVFPFKFVLVDQTLVGTVVESAGVHYCAERRS